MEDQMKQLKNSYVLTVIFTITDDNIVADLRLPNNLLTLNTQFQVSMLDGLSDQYSSMDIKELNLSSDYNLSKVTKSLINLYNDFFPLGTSIEIYRDHSTNKYAVCQYHDETLEKIESYFQPVFICSLIKAIKKHRYNKSIN
jgi:hypothetical protein